MTIDAPRARSATPMMTITTIGHRDSLRVTTKLAYGLGGLSDSLKTFSFTTFLLFYYTTVLGLPGTLLALAMSVGLVWDAAIDPLIGHFSDRATVRFGRRHSFMLVGAVCAGVSFIAVFNPPSGLSTGALFAWLMASSLCLRSSNSLFMVPYSALGAELTTDYHERTSISGYRAGTILIGTLLATAAAFLGFMRNDGTTATDPKFAAGSYASIGLAFGFTMTAVGLLATFGTLTERARLASSTDARGPVLALPRTVVEAFRNPSFRVLVAASAFSTMAAAINAALALHFLTYHARIAANQAVTLYFAAFYVGALAGVLIWVRVARRVEKYIVNAGTLLVTAVVMSGGYWLVGEGRPFGTGNVWVVVLLNGLVGIFGVASAVLAQSMMGDITAQDEQRSGHRRDGTFFGIFSFTQQMSSGVAILVAGVLVDGFAQLVPGQATQSSQTGEHLAVVSSLLPAALLVCAGIVATRYRLTRQQFAPVLPEMAGRGPDLLSSERIVGQYQVGATKR
jgi:GPH family glycoside/pentoside/hexuronide:cation symporter